MKNKRLKADSVLGVCLLCLALTILGDAVAQPINKLGDSFEDTIPELYTICYYFATIGCWVVALLFMTVFKPDRELIPLIGKKGGNTFKNALIGLLIGCVTNAICVAVSCVNKDISLKFEPSSAGYLLIGFVVVFIQSSSEELLCRHLMQRHLRRGYKSPLFEILVPSLLFAVLHLANPGVTVVSVLHLTFMAICCSLVVYYFDSLWMCFMIHTGWNYTQAMIFGLPNSGRVFPLHLFTIDSARDGCWLGYDVKFGVEGSFLSVALLVVLAAVIIILGRKKKAMSGPTQETTEIL